MAVAKTTATRCRDRAYKHCTNNPIPASFLYVTYFFNYALRLLGNDIVHEKKKGAGMGLFVQCLYALSLHLVAVVFGTAIPTSLDIFGKCFIYLFTWLHNPLMLDILFPTLHHISLTTEQDITLCGGWTAEGPWSFIPTRQKVWQIDDGCKKIWGTLLWLC